MSSRKMERLTEPMMLGVWGTLWVFGWSQCLQGVFWVSSMLREAVVCGNPHAVQPPSQLASPRWSFAVLASFLLVPLPRRKLCVAFLRLRIPCVILLALIRRVEQPHSHGESIQPPYRIGPGKRRRELRERLIAQRDPNLVKEERERERGDF